MLCILYLKSTHKNVYKKLRNIDWLMLPSLQKTKYELSLLLLSQPTQMKFKQQQQQQQ